MRVDVCIDEKRYEVNTGKPIDLALPLFFVPGGPQVAVFGAAASSAQPYESGGFVGDVRKGGSCNCETYTIIPHCNGTHTECVGHITEERVFVHDVLRESFMPATLISITPEKAEDMADSYNESHQPQDSVITRKSLTAALQEESFLQSLVIRTLPNDDSKKTRNYDEQLPPYFSREAMEFIVELGIKHLLVDTPSVDRLDDGGELLAHHIFWHEGADRTITELIYAPEEVADGKYILNLQIAPFMADAAPSRPILYEVVIHV